MSVLVPITASVRIVYEGQEVRVETREDGAWGADYRADRLTVEDACDKARTRACELALADEH